MLYFICGSASLGVPQCFSSLFFGPEILPESAWSINMLHAVMLNHFEGLIDMHRARVKYGWW